MKYNQDIINFWKNDDFKNITAGGKQFPEGWDVRDLLSEIINKEDVIEVGCGYGRLVEAFDSKVYLGVDINPNGILEARKQNPNYSFKDFNVGDELDKSTWLLFYTVLLHVNHDDILSYLKTVTKNTKKVLVAEILGKAKWGNSWKYAFNRDIENYDEIFNECGFERRVLITKPYEHYEDTNISFIVYEKI